MSDTKPSPFANLPETLRILAEAAVQATIANPKGLIQASSEGKVDARAHYEVGLYAAIGVIVTTPNPYGLEALQAAGIAASAGTGIAWARHAEDLRARIRALEAEVAILRTEAAGSASLADPPSVDLSGMRSDRDRP